LGRVVKTVLRFTHSGTNTDFFQDEVARIDMNFIKDQDIFRVRKGYRAYNLDSGYYSFDVYFKIKKLSSTVYTKIETLYNLTDANFYLPDTIKMYYEYLINTDSMKYVKMKRDDYFKKYAMGRIEADTIIKINFIETTPTGVTIDNEIKVTA
jgi:hypothetical protein